MRLTLIKERKGYADGPFGQVHHLAAGPTDGPPLVLLHQTPCHLGQFQAAWPLLAGRGLRVIAVDTPGYGQSEPPPPPPTIAGYARAVVAVLDHLGIPQATVLGHHTGAAMHRGVVMMLAADGRERDGYTAAFSHDVGEPLGRIRQPALILTNTGDDLYGASCRARELRPDFAFVALDGGTHDIVDEQPGPWAAAVGDFVLGLN